jgi:hypothetical protein
VGKLGNELLCIGALFVCSGSRAVGIAPGVLSDPRRKARYVQLRMKLNTRHFNESVTYLSSMTTELPQSLGSMEGPGSMEGAMFVLSPSNADWMHTLGLPVPEQPMSATGRTTRKRHKAQADAGASIELRVEYKGHGTRQVSGRIQGLPAVYRVIDAAV